MLFFKIKIMIRNMNLLLYQAIILKYFLFSNKRNLSKNQNNIFFSQIYNLTKTIENKILSKNNK